MEARDGNTSDATTAYLDDEFQVRRRNPSNAIYTLEMMIAAQ